MKISDYCGKRVLSENGREGYCIAALASGGEVVALLCADGEEEEFTVDVRNILSVDHVITFDDRESIIKNSQKLALCLPGYDMNGKYLGTLTDYNLSKNKIKSAVIGKRKYSVEDMVCGDAVIITKLKPRVKHDVVKDGKVIIKQGTPLNEKVLSSAENSGEYIQTVLKSI